MIDEKKLIEELKKRVRTKRSTMEILRDIIPLINGQPKRKKYRVFRNHYAAPKCDDNDWKHLVEIGYAEQGEITQNCIMYHVTKAGMDFIERVTGVTILEDD